MRKLKEKHGFSQSYLSERGVRPLEGRCLQRLRPISRTLSKLGIGFRSWQPVASLVLLGAFAMQVHAAAQVWGCLLYASNSTKSFELPSRLSGYDARLRNGLGYSSYRVIAQRETAVDGQRDNILVSAGDIQVLLTSLSLASDGKYLVGLLFLEGTQQVMETQARIGQGSPLFIRGPDWRDGQIIIVVMVASSSN